MLQHSDNSVAANYLQIHGFSDGTNNASTCITSLDGVGSGYTGYTYRNDSCYVRIVETAQTLGCRGSAAFFTNKVTFTWTVNDANANYITLIAYGGDGITNAKVNTVQVGTTGTGTVNYTGLGFNPSDGKSVIFTLAVPFLIQI